MHVLILPSWYPLNNEDLKSIEEVPLTKVEKELNRSFD